MQRLSREIAKVWRTTDGQEFPVRADAVLHQFHLDFTETLDQLPEGNLEDMPRELALVGEAAGNYLSALALFEKGLIT